MVVIGGEFRFRNDTERFIDPGYASVTAREITKFEVSIDGELIDVVYAGAGGSHSWWNASGGKLTGTHYPHGIPAGKTLVIKPDKPDTAIRVDV